MSKTPFITQLFGPSPIAPIQQHMIVCEQCAAELVPFAEAVFREDWDEVDRVAARIYELEGEADELKRNIRLKLPRSLFLPVSRDHLLDILQVQDQIANGVKDIAGLVIGRRMQFPAVMHDLLVSYVHASTDAVRLAREAVDELNDLITTGFSGREIEFIEKILDRLHNAESKSDQRQIEVRRILFENEHDLNPVSVMFLYRIIDLVGKVADDSQTVGNRMMYLIAS